MASLTTIARELRDIIIDLVITTPIKFETIQGAESDRDGVLSRCSAANIKDIEERHSRWRDHGLYNRQHLNILYPSKATSYQPNILGLSLASHQLHKEATERLARFPARCALQIDLVYEEDFWLTYTNIPVRTSKTLDSLNIDLRVGLPSPDGKSIFIGIGPPALTALTEIMTRFLKWGPMNPVLYGPRDDHEVCAKHLTINCVTPKSLPDRFEVAPRPLPVERNRWEMYRRFTSMPILVPGKSYVIRSKALADYVYWFLKMRLYGAAEFQDLLYRRVGRINIQIDGEHCFDIGLEVEAFLSMTAERPRGWPRQTSEPEWMEETVKLRTARNLPVSSIATGL